MKRTELSELQALAEGNGGRLLSKRYISNKHKLRWQCHEGHVWSATYPPMRKGIWCPKCGTQRASQSRQIPISAVNQYARSRGGVCLSKDRGAGKSEKLSFRCGKGHKFQARVGIVASGHWCPECGGSVRKTLAQMKTLAKSRGGLCLSKKYFNSHTPLEWQCVLKHRWKATPTKIQNGKWCPECKSGYGERLCRTVFEQLTKATFPKCRPDWLRYKGVKLELDGYSDELGIAFEHHGAQHYEEVRHFNRAISLLRRKELDREKLKICKSRGVRVLVLREVPNKTSEEDAIKIIRNFLLKSRIPLATNARVDLKKALLTSRGKEIGDQYQVLIKSRKGKLISRPPLRATDRVTIECKAGHVWTTRAVWLQRSWCPFCAGNLPLDISELETYAKKLGGELLTRKYSGLKVPMKWSCKLGHKWTASFANMRSLNQWCPDCGRNKSAKSRRQKMDSKVRSMVASRNGRILSEHGLRFEIECDRGHIWSPLRYSITRGHWCPECHLENRSRKKS